MISSKCNWYEHWKIYPKLFLNLEKQKAINIVVKKTVCDNKEITSQFKVIYHFYQKLFKQISLKGNAKISSSLDELSLPKLSVEESC